MITSKPIATLVTVATVALAVLTALAGTGVLSGRAAALVAAAIGLLNVGLGLVAHSKVTPLAAPKDNSGRRLVPVRHDAA